MYDNFKKRMVKYKKKKIIAALPEVSYGI